MRKNIIIELVNGERITNNPEINPNFDDPAHIARFLHDEGEYTIYIDENNYRTIGNYEFVRADFEETQPITIVGGGHKYVKLQHVFELMKHAKNMWSLPYYEFDELTKTKKKIDNTMEWLERNAKTKEELK